MNIINRLPDDIVIHIYTKCLKRYRFHKGVFIKLIDFDKYKFLEKYTCRKIKKFNKFNYYNYNNDNDDNDDNDNNDDNDENDENENPVKYSIQCQLPNLIDINRKDSQVDDDMFCITFTIIDGSLKCDVDRFRLKKIEDIAIKSNMNIYHKGNFKEYDWEVLSYTYEI
jgi:hypothetical protein